MEIRRAKRNRLFVILGVLIVVALVATAVYVIVNSSSRSSSDDGGDGVAFSRGENSITAQVPDNVTEWGGISLAAKDGKLTAGAVAEGKPTITIYFDYLCHYCGELEKEYADKLTEMAKNGEITLVYQPVSVVGGENSNNAVQADFYVASVAPDKFADFHNAVFSEMSNPLFDKNGNPQTDFTDDQLLEVAKNAGLNDEQVTGLRDVFANGTYSELVNQVNTQFGVTGLTGTPAAIVDDRQIVRWPNGGLTTAIDKASKE